MSTVQLADFARGLELRQFRAALAWSTVRPKKRGAPTATMNPSPSASAQRRTLDGATAQGLNIKTQAVRCAALWKDMWKFIGLVVAGLLIAGLGLSLCLHRQGYERLQQQNRQLQAQVEQLKADLLSAEKQPVPEPVTVEPPIQEPSLEPKERAELLRLRNEVARLRTKAETREESLRKRRESAAILLVNAEQEFARLTNLYAQQLVSSQLVARSQMTADWLRAEAKGHAAEAAQIRLRQAEARFAHVAELHRLRLASEAEYARAKSDVEAQRAEFSRDEAQADQIKLHQAEEELARAAELHAQALISDIDYKAARRKVELLRAQAKR